MIRVTVELLPLGSEEGKTTLGVAEIANVGGDRHVGRYRCTLFKWGHAPRKSVWKKGWIDGFPRLRLGPWDLLFRCLREIVGNRNEPGKDPLVEDVPQQAASYWKARAFEAEDKIAAMRRVVGRERAARLEEAAASEIAERDGVRRRGSIPVPE